MSLTSSAPQPSLAWQFESSNVDYVTGLAPTLSTIGTYAATTGGTITTVGGQRIHSFTSVGTTSITFLVPVTASILVVGGGGGGGGCGTNNQTGGGGGAGEFYYNASYSIPAGTYTVTVGAGGTAGIGSTTGTSGGSPTSGGDSIFSGITCNGGGYGGANGGKDSGAAGGSGGGASRGSSGGASVKTAGGSGNSGGSSGGTFGSTAGGGGGGGAGGAGANAGGGDNNNAAGGAGLSNSISGAAVTYAAGGSGGSRNGIADGAAGTTNRGNGGQGGGGGSTSNGGNGGSGIVIISYPSVLYPAPTYVPGEYGQAISFNNTLLPSGTAANSYASYNVTSFGLSSNSGAVSLWLNSGLTYPIAAGTNPYYITLAGTTYYSFQTETAARSSINFQTGSSPSVLISSTGQTGVWNHYCAVFSNVGTTGASNTASYFYLNGSLVGSGNTLSQAFTSLTLGAASTLINGALCSIDDLRLFKTALTAAQVQSIYNAQGMPSRCAFSNVIGSSKVQMRNS